MAVRDPNPDGQDRNVEEPGDTGAFDIVGRTGEEMPGTSHDGIENRSHPADGDGEDDEDVDGHPV